MPVNIGNNGAGLWDNTTAPVTKKGPAMSDNIMKIVGDEALTPKYFNGGTASSGSSMNGASADQGTGNPNRPSPDQSLLGRANTSSPDQGTGAPNKPSPDASLLRGSGKKGDTRQPSFGGVEKGVQIQ